VVIYDEIYKAKGWKRNLKGVYDTLNIPTQIIVTGSARLDLYKKGSDSLMGRYVGFRLHPFSLGELQHKSIPAPGDVLSALADGLPSGSVKRLQHSWMDLFHYSGFPEPLLAGDRRILNIWRRGRIDKIVRQDLRDLSRIPELSQVESARLRLWRHGVKIKKIPGRYLFVAGREELACIALRFEVDNSPCRPQVHR